MIAALQYDQLFPIGGILVPAVRLEFGQLRFRPEGLLRDSERRADRLVFDFANLAGASEAAFLRFARVWGMLGLCRHGESVHHQKPVCLPRRVGEEFVETIARWRGRARYVRSLLNIKSALNRGQAGNADDWRLAWRGPPPTETSAAAQRLGVAASIFLSTAQVQPMLHYVDQGLTFTFISGNLGSVVKAMDAFPTLGKWLSTAGNLYAAIAIRTALALQEGPGWAICSNPKCRHLYRPKRQPAEDRWNFCGRCGKRASWRMSKQGKRKPKPS
jgi:hypothetical protein